MPFARRSLRRGTPLQRITIATGSEHPSRGVGGTLRVVAWNVALAVAGLALVVAVGEAYFRLTVPFMKRTVPGVFVPGLGNMLERNAEVQWTNRLEFWTTSRSNSLGFLDRELLPTRTVSGCHVVVIGDSYVEAMEVPILAKFHVRLEALAAEQLPDLDVTTSAFGRSGTGQIAQLPYYDVARRFAPKLVVLVFVGNDIRDNHPILKAMASNYDPEAMPWVTAARSEDGAIRLRPPVPMRRLAPFPPRSIPLRTRALHLFVENATIGKSHFGSWLQTRVRVGFPIDRTPWMHGMTEHIRQLRDYDSLLRGWRSTDRVSLRKNVQVPVAKEALAFTAFALDRFKENAQRDGAALVILATHTVGDFALDHMSRMAATRDIPVIELNDFVVRNGGKIEELSWRHDWHWNVAGHRWAARALLEHLRQSPRICE